MDNSDRCSEIMEYAYNKKEGRAIDILLSFVQDLEAEIEGLQKRVQQLEDNRG